MRQNTLRNYFYLVDFEGMLTPVAPYKGVPVATDAAERP